MFKSLDGETPIPTWLTVATLVGVVMAIAAYHLSHTSLGHTLAAPVVCPGGGQLSTEVGTKVVTPDPSSSSRSTEPDTAYDVSQHCVWPDGRSSTVSGTLVWLVLLGMELVPLLLVAAPLLFVRESRRAARAQREERAREGMRAIARARYEHERRLRDDG